MADTYELYEMESLPPYRCYVKVTTTRGWWPYRRRVTLPPRVVQCAHDVKFVWGDTGEEVPYQLLLLLWAKQAQFLSWTHSKMERHKKALEADNARAMQEIANA